MHLKNLSTPVAGSGGGGGGGVLDTNMKHGIFLPVHINTVLTLKYTLLRPLSYMLYNSNAVKTCE